MFILSRDGELISAAGRTASVKRAMGDIATAISSSGEAAEALGLKRISYLLIRGARSNVLLCWREHVVGLMEVDKDANIGLCFCELESGVEEAERILGSMIQVEIDTEKVRETLREIEESEVYKLLIKSQAARSKKRKKASADETSD